MKNNNRYNILNFKNFFIHDLQKNRIINRTLKFWLECLPMAQETWVQSQVESYQRLKK